MRTEIKRETKETRIVLALELEAGTVRADTGIGFFDHLLGALAHHARWGLEVTARGDLATGGHHLVEDIGLVLGQALAQAWGDRMDRERYGWALVPMDDALVEAAVDAGGRSYLQLDFPLPYRAWGAWETDLWPEFLRALTTRAGITLHLRVRSGHDPHHLLEAGAKALGIALARAAVRTPRGSTKGVLECT